MRCFSKVDSLSLSKKMFSYIKYDFDFFPPKCNCGQSSACGSLWALFLQQTHYPSHHFHLTFSNLIIPSQGYYFVLVFIKVSLVIFRLFLKLIKSILNSNLIKCACSSSQINATCKFNKLLLIPSSETLMKTLNSICYRNDHCKISADESFQLDN